jgi:hypothetical protein
VLIPLIGQASTPEQTYQEKVLAIPDLVAYWPLDGDYADLSGNGFDGSPSLSGLSFVDGVGDGGEACHFDGVAGWVDLFSSGLANAIDRDEGTMLLHIRMTPVVSEGVDMKRIFYLSNADGSQRILVQKHDNAREVRVYYLYGANPLVWKSVKYQHISAEFVDLVVQWSKANDYLRIYGGTTLLDGVSTLPSLTDVPTIIEFGKYPPGGEFYSGDLAHVAIWSRLLTVDERTTLAFREYPCRDGYLGGSITKGSNASDDAHKFRNLVHSWLAVTYPYAFQEVSWSAVTGSHSWQNLFRLAALIALRPRTIVIDSAVNDEDDNCSRYSAEAIIRLLRVALPNTKLIGLLNIRVADVHVDDPTNTDQQIHDDWVALLTHYSIPYADFAAEVQANVPVPYHLTQYLADTVHPNDFGHATIATLVEAQMAAFLPPVSLPARLRADSADFEATPQVVYANTCSRTGTWIVDVNGAYVSSEVGATMTLPAPVAFRSLGISDGVEGDAPVPPSVGVSLNGGAYVSMFLWENGKDLGSVAVRTVSVKLLSGTVKIQSFWFI